MSDTSNTLVLVSGGSDPVARQNHEAAPTKTEKAPAPKMAWQRAVVSLKSASLAVLGFSTFINLLVLALPIYTLQVFDRVLNGRSMETLVALTVILVVLLLAQNLLDTLRATIMRRAGMGFEMRLSSLVMRRAVEEAARGNAHASSGANDLKTVRSAMAAPNAAAIFDIPWAPAFLFLIYLMHPMLGNLVAGALGVLCLLALASLWAAGRPSDEESVRTIAAGEDAIDYLRNADAVRALGMGGALANRWSDSSVDILDLNAKVMARVSALLGFTKFIRMAVQGGIMGLGAYLVVLGEITPGTMIAASILMARALAPAEQAVSGWRGWVDSRAAFKRLSKAVGSMSEDQPEVDLPLPSGFVTLGDVSYVPLAGEKPVLSGVTINIGAGSSLGIVGPSGAGKSTLARVMAGSLEASGGRVSYDGAQRNQWDSGRFGQAIGYLPQDVQLLNGTVAENIARFQPDFASRDVIEAAQAADVHDLVVHLPKGYDTRLGADGVRLSGGQRQRIGLARALFGKPNLIILDEPSANLDPEGERALHDAIRCCVDRDATVIVVSHSPNLLRAVNHVLVLRDGQVQAVGPRDEIIQRVKNVASNVRKMPEPAPEFRSRASRGAL
ncbi:MAG: type I secretion system permease/ATPase [Pseudomonadota bacterium]